MKVVIAIVFIALLSFSDAQLPFIWTEASTTGPVGTGAAKITNTVLLPNNPGFAIVSYGIPNAWIFAVNITNPAAIFYLSPLTNRVTIANTIQGNRLVGNFFYIVTNLGALWVIDTTNPAALAIAGTLQVVASAHQLWDVDVQPFGPGLRAYLTSTYGGATAGLSVVDVSNPAAMFIVNAGVPGYTATAVRVVGNYAYVHDYDIASLNVYDISGVAIGSPPILVATSAAVSHPCASMNVYSSGGSTVLYLGSYSTSNFYTIDISLPTTPVLTSTLVTNGVMPNHCALTIRNNARWSCARVASSGTGCITVMFSPSCAMALVRSNSGVASPLRW